MGVPAKYDYPSDTEMVARVVLAGSIKAVAMEMGIPYTTFHQYLRRRPALQATVRAMTPNAAMNRAEMRNRHRELPSIASMYVDPVGRRVCACGCGRMPPIASRNRYDDKGRLLIRSGEPSLFCCGCRSTERVRVPGRRSYVWTGNASEYAAIVRRDPCSYCGIPRAGQADHITPVAYFGPNEWENLTAACHKCNPSKRDRTLLGQLLRQKVGEYGR